MKKTLSWIICVSLAAALFAGFSANAADYSDTATHWGKAAIDEWSGYGIVQGSEGKFRPNDPITRAEMATIVAKLLKLTEKAANTFTDLPETAWYTENVLKCAKAGIINGYTDKTFRPNNKITRQEAMVLLGRALGIKEDKSISLAAFKDASTVASWAEGYVKSMVARKIVNGTSADTLSLSANINRASVVTILSNAIDKYVTTPGTVRLNAEDKGITLIVVAGVTVEGENAGDVYYSPAASSQTGTAAEQTPTSGGASTGGASSGGSSSGGASSGGSSSGGSSSGGSSSGGGQTPDDPPSGGDSPDKPIDTETSGETENEPGYQKPETLPKPKSSDLIPDEDSGGAWTPVF